jgi:hypothetical integral membrane protein (TIGR02206 family)
MDSTDFNFVSGYSLPAFQRFSIAHCVAVACIFAAALLAAWVGRRLSVVARRRTALVLAVLWGGIELYWILSNMGACERTRDCLPLHMCDLSIIVGVLALATHRQVLFEILYFFGLGGTTQALATPDLPFGFPSEPFFQFFVGHGGIVVSTAYLIGAFSLRPTWLSVRRVIAIGYAYLALIAAFNRVAGTNFAYTRSKPPFGSLFDYLGPWPWYVMIASLIAVLNILVLYLPYWWLDHHRRDRTQAPDLA